MAGLDALMESMTALRIFARSEGSSEAKAGLEFAAQVASARALSFSAASLALALGRVDAAVAAAVSAGTSARSGLAADFADGEAPGVAWWGTDVADAVVALVGVPDAAGLWSADAGA